MHITNLFILWIWRDCLVLSIVIFKSNPPHFFFAHDILNAVEIDKIRSEVNSLSNEIVLNTISNATVDDNKQGNVYVAEVTVVCEKNRLVVKKKVGIFPFYKIYLDKSLTVYITTETKYLKRILVETLKCIERSMSGPEVYIDDLSQ